MFIADGVDNSYEYIISYDSGSESLNFTLHCTGGSCQHTFSVPNSSQVQQYTVSVAVRNLVGVGTASAPVTIGMYVADIVCLINAILQYLNSPSGYFIAYKIREPESVMVTICISPNILVFFFANLFMC